MKKKFFYAGIVIFCAAIGTAVYKKTKEEQENARKEHRHVPYGPYEAALKRPLDLMLSGLALVILSPVMLATAVLVRMKLGKPVIFKQERSGKDGVPFSILKFRTMLDKDDEKGNPLPDDERLTEFGKKLRSTSLDELPELINIIKGDMAAVGPRPLLMEYLSRYSEWQSHRHDVRPGLTGLAQVSGRNAISWDEKFEDDIEYIDKITFFGDLKIVFRTLGVILRGSGISSNTSETMEKFMGSVNR